MYIASPGIILKWILKKIWNDAFQFKSNILDCKLIKISENSNKIFKKELRYIIGQT